MLAARITVFYVNYSPPTQYILGGKGRWPPCNHFARRAVETHPFHPLPLRGRPALYVLLFRRLPVVRTPPRPPGKASFAIFYILDVIYHATTIQTAILLLDKAAI
ncbi:hypothetical protein ES705_33505 [subsurface metagenome]